MESMQNTYDDAAASVGTVEEAAGLPKALAGLLAAIAGAAVATLYYTQPMLAVMGRGLHATVTMLGLVPMLTQLGYAGGILFLAPLGDRVDRRQIILAKAVLLAGALLASAFAPGIGVLLAASFVIGLAATLAQDVVSSSATLAPERHRGKVVGTVMTGLLLGILLSRVISGVVAERYGWRTMLLGAAVSIAVMVVLAWRGLPRIQTTTRLGYGALLASLGHLWQRHHGLRRAALAQGMISVGFSAFWSSLALMLSQAPFHLGSAVAGAFGLAGAAGAIVAPLAGRLSDRHGPEIVTRLGTTVATVAFGLMLVGTWLSPHAELVVLGMAVVGFDLGVQATLIAHQTIIYSIEPAARSRLNAVLFTVMFVGMAVGAGLGSLALAWWGWRGVTILAAASSAGALLLRLSGRDRPVVTRRGESLILEG